MIKKVEIELSLHEIIEIKMALENAIDQKEVFYNKIISEKVKKDYIQRIDNLKSSLKKIEEIFYVEFD